MWLVERFTYENIQRGAGYTISFERLEQSVFVHDPATRGIDQECRCLHQSQFFLANEIARVVIKRAMNGDEVRLLHNFFKRNHANAEPLGDSWVDKGIEGDGLRH